MNRIRLVIALTLLVAWSGGAMREKESGLFAGGGMVNSGLAGSGLASGGLGRGGLASGRAVVGSPEIDSIVLSFTQGGDGKEARTGFRMDIDAGQGVGASGDPVFTVYTCGTEDQSFDSRSTADVILKPAPCYKGRLDLATFQRSGGRLHIWPICYAPNSTNGVDYDLWDVTNVVMTIYFRPSVGRPNPMPIGGPDGSLVWNLEGPKMLVLSSEAGNEADLLFDGKLRAEGLGN